MPGHKVYVVRQRFIQLSKLHRYYGTRFLPKYCIKLPNIMCGIFAEFVYLFIFLISSWWAGEYAII